MRRWGNKEERSPARDYLMPKGIYSTILVFHPNTNSPNVNLIKLREKITVLLKWIIYSTEKCELFLLRCVVCRESLLSTGFLKYLCAAVSRHCWDSADTKVTSQDWCYFARQSARLFPNRAEWNATGRTVSVFNSLNFSYDTFCAINKWF